MRLLESSNKVVNPYFVVVAFPQLNKSEKENTSHIWSTSSQPRGQSRKAKAEKKKKEIKTKIARENTLRKVDFYCYWYAYFVQGLISLTICFWIQRLRAWSDFLRSFIPIIFICIIKWFEYRIFFHLCAVVSCQQWLLAHIDCWKWHRNRIA